MRFEPDNVRALYFRAALEEDQGNFGSAARTYARIRELNGDDPGLVNQVGMALARAGRHGEANAAFDEARKRAGDAQMLNTLCWGKAIENVALERAVEECNASLELRDHPATRDSRAMVYLRMGRLEEALDDFNSVLANQPGLAISLFGRAITRVMMGDLAGARSDAREARRIWPDVDQAFRTYGMAIPAELAAPSS